MKKFLYRFENRTVVNNIGRRYFGAIFIMIDTQNHCKFTILKLCAQLNPCKTFLHKISFRMSGRSSLYLL